MPHPLVTQLRFTRSEWLRGLEGVTAEEAVRRFGPINPIAWMIDDAWAWWRAVTAAADPSLDTLTGARLTRRWKRERSAETPGTKLPDFVGGFGKAQYRPER